jgi:hypothetical protein
MIYFALEKVMKVISEQEEIQGKHGGRHNTFQSSTLDGDEKSFTITIQKYMQHEKKKGNH